MGLFRGTLAHCLQRAHADVPATRDAPTSIFSTLQRVPGADEAATASISALPAPAVRPLKKNLNTAVTFDPAQGLSMDSSRSVAVGGGLTVTVTLAARVALAGQGARAATRAATWTVWEPGA